MKKKIPMFFFFVYLFFNSILANSWHLTDIETLVDPVTNKKNYPKALFVSGDGKVIYMSFPSRKERSECISYRWTKQTGYEKIGVFCIQKVNYQGNIIYGSDSYFKPHSGTATYRWTAEEGKIPLPLQDGIEGVAVITAMNNDGGTFAGYIWNSKCTEKDTWPMKAFVWRENKMEYLEAGTRVVSISDDGNIALVQKNDWKPHELCPVNSSGYTRYRYMPYAMRIDNFMNELSFDETNKTSANYVQQQIGIKYKLRPTQEKKVLSGLWKKGERQVQWIGQYFPVELSSDGQSVLLRSYNFSEYRSFPENIGHEFLSPWPFLLWNQNKIIMTGWFAKGRVNDDYFLPSNQLPEGMGFYVTTEENKRGKEKFYLDVVNKSRAHCGDMGPASRNGLFVFCMAKSLGYGPTLIFEKTETGITLEEWANKNKIETDIKFYDVQSVIDDISDDGKVWVGVESYQNLSKKEPRIFVVEYKENE